MVGVGEQTSEAEMVNRVTHQESKVLSAREDRNSESYVPLLSGKNRSLSEILQTAERSIVPIRGVKVRPRLSISSLRRTSITALPQAIAAASAAVATPHVIEKSVTTEYSCWALEKTFRREYNNANMNQQRHMILFIIFWLIITLYLGL